jgi:hypothetical protein
MTLFIQAKKAAYVAAHTALVSGRCNIAAFEAAEDAAKGQGVTNYEAGQIACSALAEAKWKYHEDAR